jgi:ribosomal-protein-alanine N-acetyltransferase
MKHDIFISYHGGKGDDSRSSYHEAEKLRDFLLSKNQNPFLCKKQNPDDFYDAINDALLSCRHFILIAKNKEMLSEWVYEEIKQFDSLRKNGEKPNCVINAILFDGITEKELYSFNPLFASKDVKFGERSFEEIYRQIAAVESNNAGTSDIRHERQNIENLMHKKLEEMSFLQDNYYARESVSRHFDTIAASPVKVNIFLIDQTVNISAIFYQKVAQFTAEGSCAAWFFTFHEAEEFVLKTGIDVEYLFIDSLRNETEIEALITYSAKHEHIKIYSSTEIEIYDEDIENVSFYEIKAFDDAELEEFIISFCHEKNYTDRKLIFDEFKIPVNINFRNSGIIKIIMSEIKKAGVAVNPGDALGLYKIVDDYLKNLTSNSRLFFEKVADAIIQKKIKKIPLGMLNDFENTIKTYCSLNIVKISDNSLEFINTDYCNYVVALRLLETKGEDAKDGLEGFLNASTPFFVKSLYDSGGNLLLKTCEKYAGKEQIVYLFFNDPDVLHQLYKVDGFKEVMLEVVKHFTEMAAYDEAKTLLDLFDESLSPGDIQYTRFCAEKMFFNYWNYHLLDNEDIIDPHYLYYKGIIKFCTDKYAEATAYLEKALQLADKKSPFYVQIFFNYMEALIDFGDVRKVNKMIPEIVHKTTTSKDKIMFNFIKGNLYLYDIDFETAESLYYAALNTAYSIYEKRELARMHGALGSFYMYAGRYAEAEAHIKENIRISLSCCDYNGIGISHQLFAELMFITSRFEEAFNNFSYSYYFSKISGNQWRSSRSLLFLNLFQNFSGRKTAAEAERDLSDMESLHYKALSYWPISFNVLNDPSQALEYLQKGHDVSFEVGNILMQKIIDNLSDKLSGRDPETLYCLKPYCDDLFSIAQSIKGLKNGIQTAECKLPFYKYREMETEQLNLVYLFEKDAYDIFEYASRDLPTRYVMWHKHKNIGDAVAFINYSKQEEIKGGYFLWGIRLKNNLKIIGTMELVYNKNSDDVEIGIILSDDYWKNGFATEVLAQLIEFCKVDLNLKRITGICFTANTASARMMMKQGFVFSETIPDYHTKPRVMDRTGSKYIKVLED